MIHRIFPTLPRTWWYALIGYSLALLLPLSLLILSPSSVQRDIEAALLLLVGLAISLVISRLVAARAQAEEERSRLYDLLLQAPAVIAILRGPDHRIELASTLSTQVVGRDSLVGKTVQEVIPEVDLQGFFQLLDQIYTTGVPFVGDELAAYIDRQGNGVLDEVYFNCVFQPARARNGSIEGILVHAVEVTELVQAHKRAEELVQALEAEKEALRRTVTERKRLESEVAARASELEAIFAAVTDPLFVYDRAGGITRMNPAGHRLISRYIPSEEHHAPVAARANHFVPLDAEGHPCPLKQIPVLRILQGESLAEQEATDLAVRTLDGEEILLNVTDAPLLDAQGQLTGAVAVAREVTRRRTLELRTHEALQALLTMAESLVLPPASDHVQNERHLIAQRLIELTCRLLGCRTAGIILLTPESGQFQPAAGAGFDSETEQQFWQQFPQAFIVDYLSAADIETLRSGQPLLFDLVQLAAQGMPTYGVQMVLCAPMLMEGQLVGLLAIDYDTAEHKYPLSEEKGLISAIAKISLLVLERERLLEERTAAQARSLALQETTRRMDEFLSMTSHELRTPLATIKGCTQLAQRQLRRLFQHEGPLSADELYRRGEEFARLLERVNRQANVQDRLVGDLLDVSRIQAGKLDLYQVQCDLLKIVREVVEDQRQITPQCTLSLDIVEDEDILVLADAQRIGQVLSNYLNNALKFSPDGQPVSVSVRSAGTEVRVAVRDEGPGLLPDEQQRVWSRFEQGNAPMEQREMAPGLGLGLYICQTIIRLHQGLVGVESQPDQGSTFWFTLPIVAPLQHEEHTDVQSDHHGLAPGL